MSDFMDLMTDLLPLHSELRKPDNELRKVLDKTLGAFMDDKGMVYDELFLQSATGGWLDAHGRDYGVLRRTGESDESYRNRIIFEKLEYLTVDNLRDIYGVELYCYDDNFNPTENVLTSDNCYLSDFYLGVVDEDTQKIINNKFIVENGVYWFNGGSVDYIYDTSNQRVLNKYIDVYSLIDEWNYFQGDDTIKSVKLTLPKIKDCSRMFSGCAGLVDADLDLSNAYAMSYLFLGCSALKTVKLNMPKMEYYTSIFGTYNTSTHTGLGIPTLLESIEVTIPDSKVSSFKSYVNGLHLSHLTSLKINGVEYVS